MSKAKEVAGWAYKLYVEGQKVTTKEEQQKEFELYSIEDKIKINRANDSFIKQLKSKA